MMFYCEYFKYKIIVLCVGCLNNQMDWSTNRPDTGSIYGSHGKFGLDILTWPKLCIHIEHEHRDDSHLYGRCESCTNLIRLNTL